MLSKEEEQALAKQLRENAEQMKQVAPEELAQFPAQVEILSVPTCVGAARVYAISEGEGNERPLILNFHGGGFVGKRMLRDERFCRKLACRFGAVVLDVDYRLAPEYPYPTAQKECWDVAAWAVDHARELGADSGKLVLVGHSSGGNLVAGLCMRNAEEKKLMPRCAVIDCAPMDLFTDPGEKPRSICDMPADRARMYNASYVSPEQAKDPFVSPLFAEESLLAAFPDTLVLTAGLDSLCLEAEAFALKLAQAGVCVTVQRFQDSIHGFVVNQVCQWQQGQKRLLDFISSAL